MENLYDRKLRVQKVALLSLWSSGLIGPVLIGIVLFWDHLFLSFLGLSYQLKFIILIVAFIFLSTTWRALYWTFFWARISDYGIEINTLFGNKQMAWSSLDGFDGEGPESLILFDTAGEKVKLHKALHGMPEIFPSVLERVEPYVEDVHRNVFHSESKAWRVLMVLPFYMLFLALFMWSFQKEDIWVLILSLPFLLGISGWAFFTELRRVEIEEGSLLLIYCFKRRTVDLDDLKHVSLGASSNAMGDNDPYVNLVTEYLGDIPIRLSGKDLLPLYYRLKEIVN